MAKKKSASDYPEPVGFKKRTTKIPVFECCGQKLIGRTAYTQHRQQYHAENDQPIQAEVIEDEPIEAPVIADIIE